MKRISLHGRDTKVSGYFAHHEADIFDALVDDSSPTRDSLDEPRLMGLPHPDLGQAHTSSMTARLAKARSDARTQLAAFYVSNRSTDATPHHVDTLLSRLPGEFNEIYQADC
jgi:hypothetical protein